MRRLGRTILTRSTISWSTVADSGAAVFEIGPGTGLATRRLLSLGAALLVAIEPDARLAEYLRGALPDPALGVVEAAFEDAALEPAAFDLGVAATSFHWLEQAPALAKVKAALKLGCWWAMGWNNFGDDAKDDPFQAATDHLFAQTPDSPSHGEDGRPPFALDQQARLADLIDAGFVDAEAAIWRWRATLDTVRVVALYSTFSPIQALAPDQREAFLRDLTRIADEQFGGQVERPFATTLYTARRP